MIHPKPVFPKSDFQNFGAKKLPKSTFFTWTCYSVFLLFFSLSFCWLLGIWVGGRRAIAAGAPFAGSICCRFIRATAGEHSRLNFGVGHSVPHLSLSSYHLSYHLPQISADTRLKNKNRRETSILQTDGSCRGQIKISKCFLKWRKVQISWTTASQQARWLLTVNDNLLKRGRGSTQHMLDIPFRNVVASLVFRDGVSFSGACPAGRVAISPTHGPQHLYCLN